MVQLMNAKSDLDSTNFARTNRRLDGDSDHRRRCPSGDGDARPFLKVYEPISYLGELSFSAEFSRSSVYGVGRYTMVSVHVYIESLPGECCTLDKVSNKSGKPTNSASHSHFNVSTIISVDMEERTSRSESRIVFDQFKQAY